MNRIKTWLTLMALVVVCSLNGGCATYRSLDTATSDSPKVFSGTRMDIHAIRNDRVALLKFNAVPPKYPWIDLPFSFIADFFLLFVTVPPATQGGVFEP